MSIEIPREHLVNEIEERRDYPISPGICAYRPESMLPTTFGTAKRFRPKTLNYTQHATKLSALDFNENILKNVCVPSIEKFSKRKDNFLTKE